MVWSRERMGKPASETAGARRGDVGRCGLRQHAATKANGNCCDGYASIQMHVLQRSLPLGEMPQEEILSAAHGRRNDRHTDGANAYRPNHQYCASMAATKSGPCSWIKRGNGSLIKTA
jgi:hypothetical protein